MAINTLSIHLTTQGITAFNNILANGIAFTISRVELSSNIIPPASPNTWQPDGGIGLPYYVETSDVVALSAGPNNTFVMDMQLDQTIPLSINYNPPTNLNGWVGTVDNYIEIGSFALFITDPTTSLEQAFCIGYFNSAPVQKFANTLTTPGNFLDIFNNLELTPYSTDSIIYQVNQVVNAQVAYLNHIYNLPVPQLNTSNAYVVADVEALAYTDYNVWNFTNYLTVANGLGITAISGNQLTSAELYNALPTALQNASQIFSSNLLLGQIITSGGVTKKCFVISSNAATVFTTNATLPALVTGDTVTLYLLDSYSSIANYGVPTQGITSAQSTVAVSTALTASQRTVLAGANNITITLPVGSSLPMGAVFLVDTQGFTGVQLAPNAANAIYPAAVGVARYLASNSTFEYRWDGAQWKWIC